MLLQIFEIDFLPFIPTATCKASEALLFMYMIYIYKF